MLRPTLLPFDTISHCFSWVLYGSTDTRILSPTAPPYTPIWHYFSLFPSFSCVLYSCPAIRLYSPPLKALPSTSIWFYLSLIPFYRSAVQNEPLFHCVVYSIPPAIRVYCPIRHHLPVISPIGISIEPFCVSHLRKPPICVYCIAMSWCQYCSPWCAFGLPHDNDKPRPCTHHSRSSIDGHS